MGKKFTRWRMSFPCNAGSLPIATVTDLKRISACPSWAWTSPVTVVHPLPQRQRRLVLIFEGVLISGITCLSADRVYLIAEIKKIEPIASARWG
ncbi:MAG: hypothetical protein IPN76_10485 [Saprospiraceae bacterium]|nr:hypothetical protein [Saprospiraceae bacterium]